MPADMFHLDAYLARIGHTGPRDPSLAVLRAVIAAHTAVIPFENIDVFLGRGVSLDSAVLQRKILDGRRGGYCFEQNTLLRAALSAMGFDVTGLMARVVRGMDATAQTPRTHMTLRVDLPEGPFLADVGFGNLAPTAPLALAQEREQKTLHEACRLLPVGQEWLLQARLAGGWANVYRFPLQPQFDIDYEVGNWFTSTRPGGMFVSNLIVARPADGCRMTLFNRQFARRSMDGRVERRELRSADDYGRTLADAFGIVLNEEDLAQLAEAVQQRTSGDAHPFFA
ncbi:MAG TPA: arylamine N-acetyltransferase [Acetobacteraceae bacterium]|jgi:N-hydroxyarylamine O-acetyltransferase